MSILSAFDFETYTDYLKVVSHSSSARGKLTLAQMAAKLGYRSQRSVGMVLSGKRLPSPDMIARFSSMLGHTDAEHRYFETLILLERRRRSKKDVGDVLEQLRKMSKRDEGKVVLTASEFAFLAEWYHLVIKQLVESPGFKEDPLWIRERLRKKVTVAQIKRSIDHMLRLGVLIRVDGDLRSSGKNYITQSDIPQEAGRRHHQEMLMRASEAIAEQTVESREFDSKCFRMNPQRMKHAKAELREFREKFLKKYSDGESSSVFQFNSQLFEHTGAGHA